MSNFFGLSIKLGKTWLLSLIVHQGPAFNDMILNIDGTHHSQHVVSDSMA